MERNYIRTSTGIASLAGKLLAADDLRIALREVIAQEEDKRRKLEEEELIEEIVRSLAGSSLSNRKS